MQKSLYGVWGVNHFMTTSERERTRGEVENRMW